MMANMHGVAPVPLAQEFQAFLHRLVKAGWKIANDRGKITITTATGATITTGAPTVRAELIDLRSKCVQMGLR
jgi:aspartate ammonia-lyase